MSKYPGWRTMTGAQRHNAKLDRIWESAKDVQTRFNLSSRQVFRCLGCGREESACSVDPCDGVIADRVRGWK